MTNRDGYGIVGGRCTDRQRDRWTDKGDTMHTLELEARCWFDDHYGNTYHAVRVVVDGKVVAYQGLTYGYGNQFEVTARELLEANGYDDIKGWNGALSRYCRENGIELTIDTTDVPKKSWLVPSRWRKE